MCYDLKSFFAFLLKWMQSRPSLHKIIIIIEKVFILPFTSSTQTWRCIGIKALPTNNSPSIMEEGHQMPSKSSHLEVNQNQYFGLVKNCFNVNLSFRLMKGNNSSAMTSFSFAYPLFTLQNSDRKCTCRNPTTTSKGGGNTAHHS